VFDVQDEVVESIVGTMVDRLEEAVARTARRKPPEHLAAYDLVLQGTELLLRHDRDDDAKARELFQEAIQVDPAYALAHVRLAQSYLNQFFWDDSGASLIEARRHARRALQIDEAEGWSHLIVGIAHLHERNFESVEHHLRRALELNPNDATLVAKCALLLTDLGQPEEAITWLRRAERLNPLRKDAYSDYLGLALFSAGRYREAARAFEVTAEPKFYDHVWLAATYAHLDDMHKAREHARHVLELAPEFTITRFARLEPYKSEADLEHWVGGLRKAGLPE
jgi:adenylate cyclase